MSAQVVVSAGEPVAWVFGQGGTMATANRAEADFREEKYGAGYVTPCYPAAPVVLPETPPAELIEAMAKALTVASPLAWDDYTDGSREMFRVEARAQYAVLRAWVAGGGETR